jgi:Protein of unknown function (DUF1559)
LSWFVSILPFLEEAYLPSVEKKESWDAEGNEHLASWELTVLICPAIPEDSLASRLGITSYIGMAGIGADAATFPLEDKRAGFFGYDRRVRIKDITDGLSNTMLVLETTSELGPWAAGGSSTVRGLDPENKPYLAVGGVFGVKHREDTIFRSNPVGSNIAIADGSVRWVLASLSSETLEALATIAGGDTPGDDY